MNSVNLSQGKVLIVDDELSIRRALRTTFGTLGFDIAEAVTGEQALPILREGLSLLRGKKASYCLGSISVSTANDAAMKARILGIGCCLRMDSC